MRSVATTEVAHPLTMLTTHAPTAVRPLGSSVNTTGRALRTAGGGWGTWVVGVSVITGIGPVGARRMIRVRGSSDGAVGSGGGAWGSLGAVT
jgi:hypothetical protein